MILLRKFFINVLNKHAPLKKKFLRANHAPYMTKTLRKAIMSRSQLQTKYFKNKSQIDYLAFKKQRNFCSKLYKKERKNYYNSLDIKNITDNKQFWKTIKLFLSEKIKTTSKIKLKDQDKIISNDKVAEEFSVFFENAVKSLNIKPRNLSLEDTTNLSNPVEIAIKKFQNHPSVQVIRENINLNQEFFFKQVEADEILKEIRNLDSNKNGTFQNIPSDRLKEMSEVSAPFLTNVWYIEIVSQHKFSDNLKLADVTPVFKKDDANLTKTIDQLVHYLLFQKYLKDCFKNKLYDILINIYQISYVAIGKVIALKLH